MDKIFKVINGFLGGDTVKGLIDLIPTKEKKREFEIRLRESMFKFLKIEFEDLQNARNMQIEALKQGDKFAKRFIYYLTMFLVFSTVLVTVIPFWVEIPKENAQLIYTGTGMLYTVTGSRIMSFFYGKTNMNSQK